MLNDIQYFLVNIMTIRKHDGQTDGRIKVGSPVPKSRAGKEGQCLRSKEHLIGSSETKNDTIRYEKCDGQSRWIDNWGYKAACS